MWKGECVKQRPPNLQCKLAVKEEVVLCFHMVVAEDTCHINGHTTSRKDIASEEAVVEGEPTSDLYFGRGRNEPDEIGRGAGSG